MIAHSNIEMETETPNIRAVRAGPGRELVILWKGGVEGVADITDHLAAYAVFALLRGNDALFRAVTVGEWGWSAPWSDDMEISSDTLSRLALEQGGAWLRTWRADRGMTQAEAASAVGVSPRMWRYYEAGEHPLPKTVRLACLGLDAQARTA